MIADIPNLELVTPFDLRPSRALKAWAAVTEQLKTPDLELTIGNFAILLVHFHQCRAAGVTYDPAFVALMMLLKRQIFGADADSDDDTSVDDGFELETCDEDRGTTHGWNGPPPPRPCAGSIDSLYTGEWSPFSIVTTGQDARLTRGPYDDRKAVRP